MMRSYLFSQTKLAINHEVSKFFIAQISYNVGYNEQIPIVCELRRPQSSCVISQPYRTTVVYYHNNGCVFAQPGWTEIGITTKRLG
jgi:hypothetical protein